MNFSPRFSFRISFNCASRDKLYYALIVWPFGRQSMRRMPSSSQKIEARTFPAYFCTRNFWGGVSRYAATSLIVALSPGHSDIIRFRPWSPIATGNNLDRTEKIPNIAQTNGTVDVSDPRSDILGPTTRIASACPNLHKWWTQPAHVRCPVAELLI